MLCKKKALQDEVYIHFVLKTSAVGGQEKKTFINNAFKLKTEEKRIRNQPLVQSYKKNELTFKMGHIN